MCNAASLNSGRKKNNEAKEAAGSRQGLDWRSLPHYRVRKQQPGPGSSSFKSNYLAVTALDSPARPEVKNETSKALP